MKGAQIASHLNLCVRAYIYVCVCVCVCVCGKRRGGGVCGKRGRGGWSQWGVCVPVFAPGVIVCGRGVVYGLGPGYEADATPGIPLAWVPPLAVRTLWSFESGRKLAGAHRFTQPR
jgi:hypothetical protein